MAEEHGMTFEAALIPWGAGQRVSAWTYCSVKVLPSVKVSS